MKNNQSNKPKKRTRTLSYFVYLTIFTAAVTFADRVGSPQLLGMFKNKWVANILSLAICVVVGLIVLFFYEKYLGNQNKK